jgi:hypothetical protein
MDVNDDANLDAGGPSPVESSMPTASPLGAAQGDRDLLEVQDARAPGYFNNIPREYEGLPEPALQTDFGNPYAPVPQLDFGGDQSFDLGRALDALSQKKPSFQAATAPVFFDWDKTQADRYVNSEYYQELGFLPNRDNETLYGHRQTFGDTMQQALAGGSMLAWNTFKDGWAGWGRMVNALFNWGSDSSFKDRLMGSSEDLAELDRKQKEIFNEYAIFRTPESEGSIFNRQFLGDLIQQGGFAAGTLLQFASEELLTMGAAAALKPFTGLRTFANAMRAGVTYEKIAKDMVKLGAVWKDLNAMGKLYEGLKVGAKAVGHVLPGVGDITSVVGDVAKARRLGSTGAEMAGITFGALRRTMAEANMAFTESRMEAAGTYGDLRQRLYDQTLAYKGDVTFEDNQRIESMSQQAAWKNFLVNSAVISVANRLQFDNIINSFGSRSRMIRKLMEEGEEGVLKVTGKAARDMTIPSAGGDIAVKQGTKLTQAYDKGMLGNIKAVATDFGKKKAAWEATKMVGRNMMKWEVSEGLQELIQETSNASIQKYYTDLYTGGSAEWGKSIKAGAATQWSEQGVKTFLMGAVTGKLMSPFSMAVEKAGERIFTNKAQRAAAQQEISEAVGVMNALFADPARFAPEQEANIQVQNRAAEKMEQALSERDKYKFEHAKDAAFAKAVLSAKKLGMMGALEDTFRDYGKHFDDQQFFEAFGVDMTDENRGNAQKVMEGIADRAVRLSKRYDKLHEKYGDLIRPEQWQKEDRDRAAISKRALDDAIEIMATNEHRADRTAERVLEIMQAASKIPGIGQSAPKALRVLGDDEALDGEIALLHKELLEDHKTLASSGAKPQETTTAPQATAATPQATATITPQKATTPTQATTAATPQATTPAQTTTTTPQGTAATAQEITNITPQKAAIPAQTPATATPQTVTTITPQKATTPTQATTAATPQATTPTQTTTAATPQAITTIRPQRATVTAAVEDPETKEISDRIARKEKELIALLTFREHKHLALRTENENGTLQEDEEALEELLSALGYYINVQNEKAGLGQQALPTGTDLKDFFVFLRDMRTLKKDQLIFMDAVALMANAKGFRGVHMGLYEGLDFLQRLKKAMEDKKKADAQKAAASSAQGDDDDDATKVGKPIGSYHGYQMNDKVIVKVGNAQYKYTIERISTTRVELLDSVRNKRVNMSLNQFDELVAHKEIEREAKVEYLDEKLPDGTMLIDKKERVFLLQVTKDQEYRLTDSAQNKLEEGGKSTFASEKEARDARDRLIALQKQQDAADKAPYTFDGKEVRYDDVLIGSDGARYRVVTRATDIGSQQQASGIDQQRAAIEERRAKELQTLLPKRTPLVGTGSRNVTAFFSGGTAAFYKQVLDALKQGTNIIGGQKIKEVDQLRPLFAAGKLKTEEDVYLALHPKAKEINDRYDAELAALEKQAGGQAGATTGSSQTAGGGPTIEVAPLAGGQNVVLNNLQGYELALEAALQRRERRANRKPFKLKSVNVLNSIQAYRRDGQTQEEADKELEDLILSVNEADLRKNVVIHLSRRDAAETTVREGEEDENKRLRETTGPYEVVLLYNNKPIGRLDYFDRYQYIGADGKPVAAKDLTVDQFKEIFDTEGGDAAALLRAFQSRVLEGGDVYEKLMPYLSGKPEKHGDKSVYVIKGDAVSKIMRVQLNKYTYDRVQEPQVALKDLRFNGVGGKTVVLVRRSKPGASGGIMSSETLVAQGVTKQEEDALKDRVEKARTRNKQDVTERMGNYVAVVELPNGELRFVPLLPPAYETQDLDVVAQSIAAQSKKTKDDNVEENKQGGKVAKDSGFNTAFNSDLASKLVFSVQVRNTDYTVQMSVTATGNLALQFLNRSTDVVSTIEVADEKGGPLSFSSFAELLSAVNKRIEAFDKDPKVEARQKLKLRLRAENFRKHVDAANFDQLKGLPAFVSKDVLRDVSMTFKSKSDLYQTLPEPKVAVGVAAEAVEEQKQQPPGGAAGQSVTTSVTPSQPPGGGTQQPVTSTPQASSQQQQTATQQSGAGATQQPVGTGSTQQQAATSGSQTAGSGKQGTGGGSTLPVVNAVPQQVPGAQQPSAPVVQPQVLPNDVSTAGAKLDELHHLETELEDIQDEVYSKYAETMGRDEAEAAMEQDARVVEHKKKIAQLQKEVDDAAIIAPKVIEQTKLDKAAVEQVDKFEQWVRDKLSHIIDVKTAGLIKENMLKLGVTVGKFVYSLKTLKEEKKGTIYVDPEAPFKYHEAFHAVFRLLLRDDEIKRHLGIAKQEIREQLKREGKTLQDGVRKMLELAKDYDYYEGMSQQELEEHYLEEYLADKFDAWMMDPKVKTAPANKNFFRKILDLIREFFGYYNPADLESLFYNINAGTFRDASLETNRFTKAERLQVGKPVTVPKSLEWDTITTQDAQGRLIKVKRYLPEEKSTALAASIAATFHNRKEKAGEDRHPDAILDEVIADYAKLYDKNNEKYRRYLDHPDTRRKYFKLKPELEKYQKVFTEGKEALKEAVAIHQRSMDYLHDEAQDEEEEVNDELGDRGGMDFLKNKESFGGFGSLPRWLRQYIATTTYEEEDIYGNKELKDGESLLQAVDATRVYSGILKAVAGFDDMRKMLLRMQEFGRYNVQSGHFVRRFFKDMGIELTNDSYTVSDDMGHKFMQVMKRFQQYTPDYLLFSRDLATQKTSIIKANQQQSTQNQFSIWYNAYSERFENAYLHATDKVGFVNSRLAGLELFRLRANGKKISDEDLERDSRTISALLRQQLGLSLHPLYIQYSLVCARLEKDTTPAQKQLVKAFGDVVSMKVDDVDELMETIRAGRNPFSSNRDIRAAEELLARQRELEDAGVEIGPDGYVDTVKRLRGLAQANSIFDETVNTSSFRNANGDLIYAHQLPTYHLVKVRELSQLLAEGAAPSEALNELMNDPYLANHYLLQNEQFRKMAGDLKISRIEGLSTKYERAWKGVTYGDFTEREMTVAMFELYGAFKEYEGADGKSFMTTQHLIRVIEASNTGDTVNLPVVQSVYYDFFDGMKLDGGTQWALVNEVRREFERIKRVKEEIAQIEEERMAFEEHGTPRTIKEVDGYHNTRGLKGDNVQPRGLTLFKTRSMLGGLAAEIEKEALSDSPNLSKEFEKKIGKAVNDYLVGSEQELKELLKNPSTYKPKSLLHQMLQLMLKNEVIKINKAGELENVLLPKYMAEGFKKADGKPDDKRNEALNLGSDLVQNIAQVMVNDFMNTFSFNQLLLGDQSLSLMDYVDMVKRAKGANGSGSSIYSDILAPALGIKHANTHSHIVQVDDAMFHGIYAGKPVARADAQMWMTVKSLRYTLFGLGKLTPKIAGLLDKLERGEKVQIHEVFGKGGSISYDGQTNSLKMVYYDRGRYIKTSGFVLTPELTSVKVDGEWQARQGSEELHALRRKMEDFEEAHGTITMAAPVSASKNEKANTARSIDQITDWNFQKLDNRYWRLQTENPSNKMTITDPTQAKQLVMAEQDDKLEVEFAWDKDGVPVASGMTVGQLKQLYREANAQRVKLKFWQARGELFDLQGALDEIKEAVRKGKVTPKLAAFQKKALDTLRNTGADSQLLEFFTLNENGEPKYNLNHPVTLDKFTQLFLAHFSKGVLNEKIPGRSITLVAPVGIVKEVLDVYENGQPKRWRPVRRREYEDNPRLYKDALEWETDPEKTYASEEDRKRAASMDRVFYTLKDKFAANRAAGKPTYIVDDLRHNVPEFKLNEKGEIEKDKDGNDIILDHYTEYMMAPHSAEEMEVAEGYDAIPDVLAKAFGVRIPSQAPHSNANLRLVDFLPAHYGSSAMLAPELAEVSGADYDIDKVYSHNKEYYTRRKNGKLEFIEYGRTTDAAEQFEEFVHYQKRSNKEFKKHYRELLEQHPSYIEFKQKVRELQEIIQPLREALRKQHLSEERYAGMFRATNTADLLLDEIFGISTDATQSNHLSLLMEQLRERIEQGSFENIDRDLDADLKEWYNKWKKQTDIEEQLTIQTLRALSMPETVEAYQERVAKHGEQHIGKLNNMILDAKMKLQGNKHLTESKDGKTPIAYEVASVKPLQDVLDYLKQTFPNLADRLEEGSVDVDSMLGKIMAYRNNKEGAANIGPAVNAILTFTLLNTFNVPIRTERLSWDGKKKESLWHFQLNGVPYTSYGNTTAVSDKGEEHDRILHQLSAIVSAMTDNAKERLAAKLGLNIEAVGIVSNMVAQGVPLQSAITFILQPVVQRYYANTRNLRSGLKTEEEEGRYIAAVGDQMVAELEGKLGKDKKELPLTDDLLKDNILNEGKNLQYEYSVLQSFLKLKEQTEYFNNVAGIMKLAKGLGTSHEEADAMDEKIAKLKLYADDAEFEQSFVPFDLRQVMTGKRKDEPHHNMVAQNLDIFEEVKVLSEPVFVERTKGFQWAAEKIKGNLRIWRSEKKAFNKQYKQEFIACLGIKLYQKILEDRGQPDLLISLHHGMIHDAEAVKMPEGFMDIVDTVLAIRERLPDNYFVRQFLNALPTSIQNGTRGMQENPYNATGINKAEVNTWAKLNQLQTEKLQDSFLEIYQNREGQNGKRGTNELAWALFHYLLVKDGGQFKSGTFIRYVPNFMFRDLLDATGRVNDALRDGLESDTFKSVFGVDGYTLMNEFARGYLLNVHNKKYVTKIDLSEKKVEVDPFAPQPTAGAKPIVLLEEGKILDIDVDRGVKQKTKAQEEAESKLLLNPYSKWTPEEKARGSANWADLEARGFWKSKKILPKRTGNAGQLDVLRLPFVIRSVAEVQGKLQEVYYMLTEVDGRKVDPENPLRIIDEDQVAAVGRKARYVLIEGMEGHIGQSAAAAIALGRADTRRVLRERRAVLNNGGYDLNENRPPVEDEGQKIGAVVGAQGSVVEAFKNEHGVDVGFDENTGWYFERNGKRILDQKGMKELFLEYGEKMRAKAMQQRTQTSGDDIERLYSGTLDQDDYFNLDQDDIDQLYAGTLGDDAAAADADARSREAELAALYNEQMKEGPIGDDCMVPF